MRFLRFLLCLVACGVLSGCVREAPDEQVVSHPVVAFPSDDLNRPISLKASAQRVICVGPGVTETIFAIGAQKQLVGRDQFSQYPAAAKSIPIAGDYTGPFIEKAAALKPDLIIVQGETYDSTRAGNWQKKLGVPVAVLVPTDLDAVANGITKIGQWMGHTNPAQQLAHKFEIFPIPTATGQTQDFPKAFFEVQRSPLWTAGKKTLIHSVMEHAGVANIANDVTGYKQFSAEALLSRQPDLYIVAGTGLDASKELQMLKQDPMLGKLQCVQRGDVIVLPADWLLRAGPRLLDGLEALKQQVNKQNKGN